MPRLTLAAVSIPPELVGLALVVLVLAGVLVAHKLLALIACRIAARSPGSIDDLFVARGVQPSRWLAMAITLAFLRPSLALPPVWDRLWLQLAGLIVPGVLGWFAIAMIRAFEQALELRWDIAVEDNLRARRRRTRGAILARIAIFLVGFVAICLMLLSIPSIRSIGVTLMASAGLAGLAVGAAAQPALKNIIAGVQMAFTEPIRLDDVVIIDGEWGKVEEIRLTYVVIALWDERRLIVPVAKFLEQSFQNWTRSTSKLLGSAFLYLDPTTDVPRLRAAFEALVRANPRWDGRAQVLQVTDTKPDAIEVRVLATARDAPTAFDLRCDLREALLAFVRDEMPEALPRRRLQGVTEPSPDTP